MGTIEAIKKGFGLAGKNWNLIFILFFLNVLSNTIGIPLKSLEGSSPSGMKVVIGAGAILLFLVLSVFIQAGLLGCVRDIIKKGAANLNNLFALGKKFFWRLLGLGILIGLITGLLVICCQGSLALSREVFGNVVLKSLGLFISIILGAAAICAGVFFFYAPYILINEEGGIIESMRRSVGFVRRFLGNALGTLALVVLIVFGATIVLGLLVMPLGAFRQIIGAILGSGINAYLGIVAMITFMSLYLSLAGEKK